MPSPPTEQEEGQTQASWETPEGWRQGRAAAAWWELLSARGQDTHLHQLENKHGLLLLKYHLQNQQVENMSKIPQQRCRHPGALPWFLAELFL